MQGGLKVKWLQKGNQKLLLGIKHSDL